MHKNDVIAYWLMPAKPERELFNDLIRILSHEMKAPRFEPHLTILATHQDLKSARQTLARLKANRIHLHVRGVGVSSEYRRTLFVRMDTSKPLERLVGELRRATKSRVKSPGSPHLSLLYKQLPANARRELAKSVKLPFSHIVFSEIKAVRSVAPISKRADVEAWRVIGTKALLR